MQRSKQREADIVALVEESIRSLQKPDAVSVTLHSDLADRLLRVHREGIRKMVDDLLTNSVEAMPSGGEVRVHVAGDPERVILTIADSGVGISRENIDRLFSPFFTTKPAGEGTGLGLPSAYITAREHMGGIAVESNNDPRRGPTGTTIRVTLSRRPETVAATLKWIRRDDETAGLD